MKTLTLWQPWASLILSGAKQIETRGWRTPHRGPLAIHAGVRSHDSRAEGLPRGVVLGVVELVDCIKIPYFARERDLRIWIARHSTNPEEIDHGDYRAGRVAWLLRDVRELATPCPARGYQWLWEWHPAGTIDLAQPGPHIPPHA